MTHYNSNNSNYRYPRYGNATHGATTQQNAANPHAPGARPRPLRPLPDWRPVQRKISGEAVVEVTTRPLRIPQFSFQIARARLDENGQILETSPFLSLYAIPELVESLWEIYNKYMPIREEALRKKAEHDQQTRGNYRVDSSDSSEHGEDLDDEDYAMVERKTEPTGQEGPLLVSRRR